MKNFVSLILLLFTCVLASGQVTLSQRVYDYGVIDFRTDRVIDLTITNEGDADAFLLRSNFSDQYEILFSSRTIPAGGEITLRVQYNPRKKGGFSDEIELWFSNMNEALKLKIKGDVEYVDRRNNPACPNFNERPVSCCDDNEVIVEMIDKASRKSIHKGEVRFIDRGEVFRTEYTDRGGLIQDEFPISYYTLLSQADGYVPQDTSLYINRFQNYVLLEMEKLEEEIVELEELEELGELEELEEEEIVPEVEEVPETFPVVEDDVFPESRYARNNIVFLIDVSSSMNSRGKLDILKHALLELVDALRPIDQITVITYAKDPKEILSTRPVQNKDEIKRLIRELETGGATEGAKGFNKAYSLAKRHFIEGGNNQIIVATDGAFKAEDNPKIARVVSRNHPRICTSIVGIKSSETGSRKLKEFSSIGGGSFIRMDDFDTSQHVLIEEIQKQSRR